MLGFIVDSLMTFSFPFPAKSSRLYPRDSASYVNSFLFTTTVALHIASTMPGSTDEPLELSIVIVYDSLKQIQIDSGRLDPVATLRSDLLALRIPHPRKDNITVVSGGVRFFWISYRNSVLVFHFVQPHH